MLKRSHFVPLLLASSPLVVTSVAVDTIPEEEAHHHLRRHFLAQPPPPLLQLMLRTNEDSIRNNQQQQLAHSNQVERKARVFSKSSKMSKSRKAKSAKDSKDGYNHYGDVIDDGGSVVSGDLIQYGLTDDDEEDEEEDGAQGDNDVDVAVPLLQVSFDILPNKEGSTTEDGEVTMGMGSEVEAQEVASHTDRNDTAGEGGSASILATETEQVVVSTTFTTESIDGELPTTKTSTESIDGELPIPTNSTNVAVLEKWQLNPTDRIAAGVISLVSFGSVLFISAGLFIHKRQSERAAAVAGGAATNNSEEDGSEDASSIWSANEGDDIAAAGGGQAMPTASSQSATVSSIAAMGMASPLALRLSAGGDAP